MPVNQLESLTNSDEAAISPREDEAGERWLGLRLKARRLERKLSLHQLAEISGLSAGMLSQIERGLSSPSLRSLRLLGLALGVPMSWFFAEPEQEDRRESHFVVRRGGRRLLKLTPTGVMKELLSPAHPELFEMYELLLQPGGSSGVDFYSHLGEKAGIILSGTLRLWLDGEAHFLEEGDSFQFPSTVPHQFDNPGKRPSRILWVMAPPMPRNTNAPRQDGPRA
jgi:transcriptional regulator with XRE-family HTH domain